ncbi:MAG: preprotein translocase subunit SecE [Limisphaerales bacterium]
MSKYTGLIIWVVVIGTAFGLAWYMGWLKRLAAYSQQTREELRKCTWPTRQELWGSTVLVMLATLLLGMFTVIVDFVFTWVVQGLFRA